MTPDQIRADDDERRTLARIAAKTKRTPTGCLEWVGQISGGIARMTIGSHTDNTRRLVAVHRVAWELANGPIPAGSSAFRTCGNGRCCELSHVVIAEGNARTKSMDERFWSRLDRLSGCWEWTGSRLPNGYGSITLGTTMTGQERKMTHRLAWELTNGPIPAGAFVCHRCDNPPCCNPDHLFLGTAAENSADMVSKGRSSKKTLPGSSNGRARLTDEQVADIRRLATGGVRRAELARRFGVAPSTIGDILTRKTWVLA